MKGMITAKYSGWKDLCESKKELFYLKNCHIYSNGLLLWAVSSNWNNTISSLYIPYIIASDQW